MKPERWQGALFLHDLLTCKEETFRKAKGYLARDDFQGAIRVMGKRNGRTKNGK